LLLYLQSIYAIMLKQLSIKNYALIQQLEIQPAQTLNIITGETGAGKSIMLGALGLLLGNRAETKVLFDETEKCIIEGIFDVESYGLQAFFEENDVDYEGQCLIRREITPAGKSRAFINDTPANLDLLKQIGVKLMDIHSQHDTLQLGSNEYQLGVVDAFAQNKNLVLAYQEHYKSYKKAESAYKKLLSEAESLSKELEYNKFLLDELLKAKLDNLNQQNLEQELEVLENVEEIKTKLALSLQYLTDGEFGAVKSIKSVVLQLNQIGNYAEKYQNMAARLQSVSIELADIVKEMEAEEEKLFTDEEKMGQLQEQLSLLYNLQKKHTVATVAELLAIRNELDRKVSLVLNLDGEIASAKQQTEISFAKTKETAKTLRSSRLAALPLIETEINGLLADLGMPNAKVQLKHSEIGYEMMGNDQVELLFSANKGKKPENLKSVASGGEFSRLMLCVKYILAGKTALPTIIFDEIDTGISGEVAIKVSKMMNKMAERHQLIVITHLPQMASNGEAHYFVYKDNNTDRTVSKVRKLSESERIHEIAQMIGGANPTQVAYESAKELLAMYR
jgi:DNA repair protein RecN (Recombination protein N)